MDNFILVLKNGRKVMVSQKEFDIIANAVAKGKTHLIMREDNNKQGAPLFLCLDEIACIYGPSHFVDGELPSVEGEK